MAFGGGTWVTQNKKLPGAYFNFINTASVGSAMSQRGIVAIALPIGKAPGTVITVDKADFITNSVDLLGFEYDADEMAPLREIFCKAITTYVYDVGNGTEPVEAVVAVYVSEELTAVTTPGTDTMVVGGHTYTTQPTDTDLPTQMASFVADYNENAIDKDNWGASIDGNTILFTAKTAGALTTLGITAPADTTMVTEGKDAIEGDKTTAEVLVGLEPYEFNVICAYTEDESDVEQYISMVEQWRDTYGKKCQLVVYNQNAPDYEGVINVVNTVSDENAPPHALVAWVAGAEAGCGVNESCTNKIYDGEYTVIADKTQRELEECMDNGLFVFHLAYGDVRVLEDINSLTSATANKGEDFKMNQVIRVIDQTGNDIAKLFNTRYNGIVPNDAGGRTSFWGDTVKFFRELEGLRAIENFDSSTLTVEQGATKKAIVVNGTIQPTCAMSQLYFTLYVQ